MNRKINIILYLLTIGSFLSCVTKLNDFEPMPSEPILTIEATLSDQPKSHRVYISYSTPSILSSLGSEQVKGAKVTLTDDLGRTETLNEVTKGIYETSSSYQGEVGRSYVLSIVLPDGTSYRSSPQLLKAAPKIEKIANEFVIKDQFQEKDGRRMGFDVTLNFKDSLETEQYYQWVWTHYERTLYCISCPNGYPRPDGTCSNGDLEGVDLYLPGRPINYQCYENCFDIAYSTDINILSDELLNGQEVAGWPIARVPFDSALPYYLLIEQRRISKENYMYLRAVKNGIEQTGTLFDTPVETPLSPNIQCIDDPQKKILGAFIVFGVDEKLVYIKRDSAALLYAPIRKIYQGREPYTPPSPAMPPRGPCIESKYRTKQTPKNWIE